MSLVDACALAFGLLSAGLALLAVVGEWRDRARRRSLRTPSEAPRPVERTPPPPEELFETAVRQALHRGFTAWWQERRGVCPGCGGATFVVEPRRDERSVSVAGGGGFVAWTQGLRCDPCGWSVAFPFTDSPPMRPLAAQRSSKAPRRRFVLAGAGGAPAGALVVGGGKVEAEPAPDPGPADRRRLSIAARVLAEVADVVAPGLPPAVAEERFLRATKDLLSLSGAPVLRVEPVDPA